eukprot:2034207-Rhodomonas_salina.1
MTVHTRGSQHATRSGNNLSIRIFEGGSAFAEPSWHSIPRAYLHRRVPAVSQCKCRLRLKDRCCPAISWQWSTTCRSPVLPASRANPLKAESVKMMGTHFPNACINSLDAMQYGPLASTKVCSRNSQCAFHPGRPEL